MRTAALLLLLTLPALSACQRTASDPTLQKAPVAAVSVADDAGSTTSAAAPPVEERQTEQYRLRIERSAIAPSHLGLRRAVEAHLAQLRDQFVGQALAAQEEGFQFDQPWELQLQVQPTLQRDDLIVLELTGSEYTGGAHGLGQISGLTFSRQTGAPLDIAAALGGDGLDVLYAECRVQIQQQKRDRLEEPGYRIADDSFFVEKDVRDILREPSNWHLEPGAAFVTFNSYAIGAYAEGTYDCTFSDVLIAKLTNGQIRF